MAMSMEEEAEDYSTTTTSSSSDYSTSLDRPTSIASPNFAIRKESSLCPCCNLPLHGNQRHDVVGEAPQKPLTRRESVALLRRSSSCRSYCSMDNDDDDEVDDEVERMMPGVLGKGVAYTVREVIAQGYVRKKGSGYDWLGSRAWKARWAVLVVSREGKWHQFPLFYGLNHRFPFFFPSFPI